VSRLPLEVITTLSAQALVATGVESALFWLIKTNDALFTVEVALRDHQNLNDIFPPSKVVNSRGVSSVLVLVVINLGSLTLLSLFQLVVHHEE